MAGHCFAWQRSQAKRSWCGYVSATTVSTTPEAARSGSGTLLARARSCCWWLMFCASIRGEDEVVFGPVTPGALGGSSEIMLRGSLRGKSRQGGLAGAGRSLRELVSGLVRPHIVRSRNRLVIHGMQEVREFESP